MACTLLPRTWISLSLDFSTSFLWNEENRQTLFPPKRLTRILKNVPILIFSPFILDATATVFRRAWQRQRIWEAHREHYYQRLIRSGWSHRRTVLLEYGLMALSSGFAIIMLGWSPAAQYCGVAAATAIYVGVAYAIDRRWAAYQRAGAAPEHQRSTIVGTASVLGYRRRPSAAFPRA